jgi:hypothetical protein
MNTYVGFGDDKPRDTHPTHCSPSILLGYANEAMRGAAAAGRPASDQLDAGIEAMQRRLFPDSTHAVLS